MSEMILPGVYIEVRPEALIVPGRVSVNNVGVVGTASRGPVGMPTLLASYAQAREVFGAYDAWDKDNPNVLSLVRALELVFGFGASTVYALRIGDEPATGSIVLNVGNDPSVTISANSPGTWGNGLTVNVLAADAASFIEGETHAGGAAIKLTYPVAPSARNRVTVYDSATRRTRTFRILYPADPAPAAGEVRIGADGTLQFFADDVPNEADDEVVFSYAVPAANSAKVTLKLGTAQEVYIAASGNDLARDINANSAFATAEADAVNGNKPPTAFTDAKDFRPLAGGSNGEAVSPNAYKEGLDQLLDVNVHIMVAAGQSADVIGDELAQHVAAASNDVNKRERIGIVGSALGDSFDDIRSHSLNSDRIVFVAPGIVVNDAASGEDVTLPGAYTAAAIAGLMASYSPHISLTNKPVPVGGLEKKFTNPELSALLEDARVLALQDKLGFKVVRGITTSTNSAWKQITTRRIVDFAKIGVRKAADPYIGMLNNDRVRGALRATLNSFLAEMVEDEMLIGYDLTVSATREQELQGICAVTMVVRPVFSIDFIKVTMFLQ